MLNRDFMQDGFFPWFGVESVLDGRNYPFHNVKREKTSFKIPDMPE